MLLLLPPSEGKTAARRGAPVDLDALSFPGLTEARRQLLAELAQASARPDAMQLLGVGPSLAPEVARNVDLLTLPSAPVHRTYTGVLYDALDWPTLPTAARRRAAARIVIVSALWGALRPSDRIPAYRFSMGTRLPGSVATAAIWAPLLDQALGGETGTVVDCRSSDYVPAWRPRGELAQRWVAIRVLTERNGHRAVVSHQAKHTRGLVARTLVLHDGPAPRRPEAVAEALSGHHRVELTRPSSRGRPWQLDVVVPPVGR